MILKGHRHILSRFIKFLCYFEMYVSQQFGCRFITVVKHHEFLNWRLLVYRIIELFLMEISPCHLHITSFIGTGVATKKVSNTKWPNKSIVLHNSGLIDKGTRRTPWLKYVIFCFISVRELCCYPRRIVMKVLYYFGLRMRTMNRILFYIPLDRVKQKYTIVLLFSSKTLTIELMYPLNCIGKYFENRRSVLDFFFY